jgi:DNA helicase-2/ATP-dependent DNA helicase PcrA
MTRAQNKLYLLNAEVRTLYGKTDFTRESMFLKEIDPKVIEGDGIYRQKKDQDHKSRDGFSKDPYRPFDGLKYSKAQSMESARGTKIKSQDLASGDFVLHSKFGKGRVLDVEGQAVTVVFDSVGTKKLAISVAPLEKI